MTHYPKLLVGPDKLVSEILVSSLGNMVSPGISVIALDKL